MVCMFIQSIYKSQSLDLFGQYTHYGNGACFLCEKYTCEDSWACIWFFLRYFRTTTKETIFQKTFWISWFQSYCFLYLQINSFPNLDIAYRKLVIKVIILRIPSDSIQTLTIEFKFLCWKWSLLSSGKLFLWCLFYDLSWHTDIKKYFITSK